MRARGGLARPPSMRNLPSSSLWALSKARVLKYSWQGHFGCPEVSRMRQILKLTVLFCLATPLSAAGGDDDPEEGTPRAGAGGSSSGRGGSGASGGSVAGSGGSTAGSG